MRSAALKSLLTALLLSSGLVGPAGHAGPRPAADEMAVPKELAVLRGHVETIGSLALTPDGRTLVSGGYDRTVKVWDVAAGKERASLSGHGASIERVRIAPDGKQAASADLVGEIRVWDLTADRPRATLTKPAGRTRAMGYAADGATFVAAHHDGSGGMAVKRWEVSTGRELASFGLAGQSAAVLSPDGSLLARGGPADPSGPGVVQVVEAASGRQRLAWSHEDPTLLVLQFSADGRTLFLLEGRAGAVRLLEVATGKVRLSVPKAVRPGRAAAALHPGGLVLALAPQGEAAAVQLLDVATGAKVGEVRRGGDRVDTLAFSAGGDVLGVAEGPDPVIRVWGLNHRLRAKPSAEARPGEAGLRSLWDDLAGVDAEKAYRAVHRLAASPGQAAAWVGSRLPSVAAADARRVGRLIAGLDHDGRAERDAASRELMALGESACAALHAELTRTTSAEVRRRIRVLLERVESAAATPEGVRVTRAVEALEWAGTAEALVALRRMAGGVPQAHLTREARAAVDRLSTRPRTK